MVKKPQKAPSQSIAEDQLDNLLYPVYGSPKLDGYCCLTEDGAYTSRLKPIRNKFIQRILSQSKYNGLHGEIVVGPPNDVDAFNRTTGAVRAAEGKPNFRFYIFDTFAYPNLAYADRYAKLMGLYGNGQLPFVTILPQVMLNNKKEVLHFLQGCLDMGYEGAMIRFCDKFYKEGRCTFKEMNLFKLKPYEDAECIIIGIFEKRKNNNEATINELGLAQRSGHSANKVGAGTLGGFKIITTTKGLPWTGKEMEIGTGRMKHDEAHQYYVNPSLCLNKPGVYKYQLVGSIDLPRQPIWKGFRDENDITDY